MQRRVRFFLFRPVSGFFFPVGRKKSGNTEKFSFRRE